MKKRKKFVRRKPTRLAAFKKTCHKWLIMKDDTYLDVLFGVYFANQHLDSKPVWLYLVGAPGAGKTVILQAWDGHESVYALSTLTPQALISGKIIEHDEEDPSLLPTLDGKVLVIKDFTVILKGRHDDSTAITGQLRDAYDGSSRKKFGTGKDTIYKAKFGVIAAVTNEIDKHLLKLSALGERFLIFRCEELTEDERRARAKRACSTVQVSRQEEEFKTAAHKVLSMKPLSVPPLSDVLQSRILDIAQFVALARTTVDRDRNNREITYFPYPEVPTRLSKQLCDLARGIAMAREKSKVTASDVRLVQKVATDCIPANRLKLLKMLVETYPEKVRRSDVRDSLKISYSAAKFWLDDLYVLEVLDRYPKTSQSYELKNMQWRLNRKYAKLLKRIWCNN